MKRMPIPTLISLAIGIRLLLASNLLVAQSSPTALSPYTSCRFSDGLKIVQIDSLPPSVHSREVETDAGTRQVDLDAGIRVMFAYPDTDFYANVKAELLPGANYPQLKQILLDSLQHLAPGNTINTSLHSPMNGLEIHGLDREKLEGGVLGVYLIFDNSAHVVTTVYFLNQDPPGRRFQTIEEYGKLRDRFLDSYSACVRKNQRTGP